MLVLPYLPYDPSQGPDDRILALTSICQDLQYLLRLSDDNFWTTILRESSVRGFLDSYLSFAERSWDTSNALTDNLLSSEQHLSRLVFQLIARLGSHKAAPASVRENYGSIIYENWLFDLPKILDICSLFVQGNEAFLKKLVYNVFKQQPNYFQDLEHAVFSMSDIIENALSKNFDDANVALDFCLFMRDTALTLERFLRIFRLDLSSFTESQFVRHLCAASDFMSDMRHQFQDYHSFQVLRLDGLASIALLVQTLITGLGEVIDQSNSSDEQSLQLQRLDNVLHVALSSRGLLQPILKHSTISTWLERFCLGLGSKARVLEGHIETINLAQMASDAKGNHKEPNTYASEIAMIKAVLPDLGQGFILACLDSCNGNAEEVIHLVLENNLPPSIAKLPRDLETWSNQSTREDYSTKFTDFKSSSGSLDLVVGSRKLKKNDKVDFAESFSTFSLDDDVRERLLYEDEYDDTYDDLGDEGNVDRLLDEQEDILKPNPNHTPHSVDQDSSAHVQESQSSGRGASRGGRGRGGRGRPPLFTANDVRAKKGEGGRNTGPMVQGGRGSVSKSWLARRSKESNKSSRANHNRKRNAMKKTMSSMPKPST